MGIKFQTTTYKNSTGEDSLPKTKKSFLFIAISGQYPTSLSALIARKPEAHGRTSRDCSSVNSISCALAGHLGDLLVHFFLEWNRSLPQV